MAGQIKVTHRNHATWWAFALHRLSGVALALFLPKLMNAGPPKACPGNMGSGIFPKAGVQNRPLLEE